MADIDLGSLVARVGLDTSGLKKGIASAQGDLRGLSGGVNRHIAGLAVVGGALTAFGLKSASTYQNVTREALGLQRIIGGSVKQASELRFAAKATGTDLGVLTTGLGLLSKHLVANDKAAHSLGFSYRDATGRIKPMADLLPLLADRFAKAPNGPEKTALALQLFGRAGKELLPFLNRGSAGLAALNKQAEQLGATLSDKDARALKSFTKAQREGELASEALQIQIGRHVTPVVTEFKKTFAEMLSTVAQNRVIGDTVGVIGAIGTVAGPAIAAITGINEGLQLLNTVSTARKARALAEAGANEVLAASELHVAEAAGVAAAAEGAAAAGGGATAAGGIARFLGNPFTGATAGVAAAGGTSVLGALAPVAIPLAVGTAAVYGLDKITPDFGSRNAAERRNALVAQYDQAKAFAKANGKPFESRVGIGRTGFSDLAFANPNAAKRLLEREVGHLREVTHAQVEAKGATDALVASDKRYAESLRHLAVAEITAEAAHRNRTAALVASVSLFDVAPKRAALSVKQVIKAEKSRIDYETEKSAAEVKLAAAGLKREVIGQLEGLEQQAPGTLKNLGNKIGPALVAELDKAYGQLQTTQALRDGALVDLGARSGKSLAEGLVLGFASAFGAGLAGALGSETQAAIEVALRNRRADAAERGGIDNKAHASSKPIRVEVVNHREVGASAAGGADVAIGRRATHLDRG